MTLVGSAVAAAARARVEPLKTSSLAVLQIVVPTDGIMPAIVPLAASSSDDDEIWEGGWDDLRGFADEMFYSNIPSWDDLWEEEDDAPQQQQRAQATSAYERARCFEAPLLVSPRLSSHCMASDGSLPTCHSSFHQH